VHSGNTVADPVLCSDSRSTYVELPAYSEGISGTTYCLNARTVAFLEAQEWKSCRRFEGKPVSKRYVT